MKVTSGSAVRVSAFQIDTTFAEMSWLQRAEVLLKLNSPLLEKADRKKPAQTFTLVSAILDLTSQPHGASLLIHSLFVTDCTIVVNALQDYQQLLNSPC